MTDVEPTNSTQLTDNDTGTLDAAQRRALGQLLRGPYVSATKHPEIFRTVTAHQKLLRSHLDNLFLTLIVDDASGIAYAKSWDTELEDSRQLFRSVPLTFIQSVTLLHLRRELVLTSPNQRTIVDQEETFEAIEHYLQATGTDKAAKRKRFQASWQKLQDYSLITKTRTPGRYEVSPVLRLIFDAEKIAALTQAYEDLLHPQTPPNTNNPDTPNNPADNETPTP
ncbi:DUF4194 domain-containing protein [Corynebacterium aquilae]|uniref:DUF4194 domain-containing protein n=1 Tax=Corynebacterium aquilae TaxID=203263 RepID=UPI00095315FE|nr:DUF4194 domain-containing protein [Corynebacterium aquilae]